MYFELNCLGYLTQNKNKNHYQILKKNCSKIDPNLLQNVKKKSNFLLSKTATFLIKIGVNIEWSSSDSTG